MKNLLPYLRTLKHIPRHRVVCWRAMSDRVRIMIEYQPVLAVLLDRGVDDVWFEEQSRHAAIPFAPLSCMGNPPSDLLPPADMHSPCPSGAIQPKSNLGMTKRFTYTASGRGKIASRMSRSHNRYADVVASGQWSSRGAPFTHTISKSLERSASSHTPQFVK